MKIGAEKDFSLQQFVFGIFLGNLSFSSVSFGSCGEEFVFLHFQLWCSSVLFFLPVLFDFFHCLVCIFKGGIFESASMGHEFPDISLEGLLEGQIVQHIF